MWQYNRRTQLGTWLKFCLLLFLSLIVWQGGIQSARADTWTVCQNPPPPGVTCDFSSIQAAITSSAVMNGDVLEFPVNKETYLETITLNKSLTFVGQTTTINAQDGGTAVTITGSPTVVMQNMIIQNGNSSGNGAGIRLNGGNLTLTNVSLNGNDVTGTGLGGALYIASGSSAHLTDVTMQLNTAVTSGGAIYNNGTLTTDDLTLTDNTATNGGGLYNNGTATIDLQSSIQRSIATESGGGVFNAASANLTLLDSDFTNNEAANGAGIFNEGTLQVTATNLGSGNVASQAGGGLYNTGQATLTNSALVQNQGVTGAGVYNAGTLTASNSTFSRNAGIGNQASANGPGLYNNNGTATLNNVTIHLTIGTSIFANGGTVAMSNTIISSVSGQLACAGGGTAVSNGYNLASDLSCTFLSAAKNDLQGLNPDLNAVNSPTDSAAFHTPKLTSPVIDAGSPATPGSGGTACLASDQRGLARPQSRQCDIGAVEIVVYRIYLPAMLK